MTIDAPLGWHVILRLVDGRVIAPGVEHRRRLTRVLHRHGRGRMLLAFRLAGDHLHILIACSREEAGRFTHAVEVALRKVLRIPIAFEAARIRAVTEQRHLENGFRYILRQERRHGIDIDPTMDASSLADLWGLRALATPCASCTAIFSPGSGSGATRSGSRAATSSRRRWRSSTSPTRRRPRSRSRRSAGRECSAGPRGRRR